MAFAMAASLARRVRHARIPRRKPFRVSRLRSEFQPNASQAHDGLPPCAWRQQGSCEGAETLRTARFSDGAVSRSLEWHLRRECEAGAAPPRSQRRAWIVEQRWLLRRLRIRALPDATRTDQHRHHGFSNRGHSADFGEHPEHLHNCSPASPTRLSISPICWRFSI